MYPQLPDNVKPGTMVKTVRLPSTDGFIPDMLVCVDIDEPRRDLYREPTETSIRKNALCIFLRWSNVMYRTAIVLSDDKMVYIGAEYLELLQNPNQLNEE